MLPIKHSLVILSPVIIHPGATGLSETEVPLGPGLVIVDAYVSQKGTLLVAVVNEGKSVVQFSGFPPPAKKPWWRFGR